MESSIKCRHQNGRDDRQKKIARAFNFFFGFFEPVIGIRSIDGRRWICLANKYAEKKDCSRCACRTSDAHVRDLQTKYVFRVLGIPCLYDHHEQHTKIIRHILFKLAAHFHDEANETSVASHRWIRWR